MSQVLNPEQWVARYGDALYAYALVRVRNADLAAELVQDTLVTAFEKRASFQGNSSEKTWLTAILKNKLVDQYRQDCKRVNWDEGEALEDELFSNPKVRGHWSSTYAPNDWDRNLAEDEALLWKVMQYCLDKLPEVWGRLLIMKSVEDIPTETICKELALSQSNLWVILHRARLRVRACIEKNHPDR